MHGLHPQGISNGILCLLNVQLLPWQFSSLLTLFNTQHKLEGDPKYWQAKHFQLKRVGAWGTSSAQNGLGSFMKILRTHTCLKSVFWPNYFLVDWFIHLLFYAVCVCMLMCVFLFCVFTCVCQKTGITW